MGGEIVALLNDVQLPIPADARWVVYCVQEDDISYTLVEEEGTP